MNIIIKTTKQCNMRCKYCYEHPHHSRKDVFTIAKIEKLFRKVRDYYARVPGVSHLVFVWHGGEPMLMPVSFYWKAFELQEKIFHGKKFRVENGFQTNLTLLDDNYLELFRKKKFGNIGVSFDVFNQHRIFKNGMPTDKIVLKNLERLKTNGIKHSILCVLTRQNIGRIKEIYRFFRKKNLAFLTVPVHHLGPHKKDLYGITPQEYARASIKLFDMWFYDRDVEPIVSEFQYFIVDLTGVKNGLSCCFFAKSCADHTIHFNPDGTAYNCTRMDFGRYVYGNIFRQNMGEIMNSKARKMLMKRYEVVKEECGDCRYFEKCYGGCPNIGRTQENFLSKSVMCPYFKAMFSHIEKRLRQHGLLTKDGRLVKDYAKKLDNIVPPADICWAEECKL